MFVRGTVFSRWVYSEHKYTEVPLRWDPLCPLTVDPCVNLHPLGPLGSHRVDTRRCVCQRAKRALAVMVPFLPSTQQSMADEEDKDRDTADCQGNVSLSVSFLLLQSESRAGEGHGDALL